MRLELHRALVSAAEGIAQVHLISGAAVGWSEARQQWEQPPPAGRPALALQRIDLPDDASEQLIAAVECSVLVGGLLGRPLPWERRSWRLPGPQGHVRTRCAYQPPNALPQSLDHEAIEIIQGMARRMRTADVFHVFARRVPELWHHSHATGALHGWRATGWQDQAAASEFARQLTLRVQSKRLRRALG